MSKIRKYLKSKAGFSFIEILIVVVIIGFIAAIVGPNIIGRLGQAKQVTARTQLGNIEAALELYYLDCGRFPTTDQGLSALREKPTMSPIPNNWNGPYFDREIPEDPWGNDYIYKNPGDHNPTKYDLYSLGSDGQEGGSGDNADITNWSNSNMQE